MTTIDELSNEYEDGKIFIYNQNKPMDICFDPLDIPTNKLRADGYSIGVNHRPIREGHVKRLVSVCIGDEENIRVVFDSRDHLYHIIDGQHIFTAYKQSNQLNNISCEVAKYKNTGIMLDASNENDRAACREYGFRRNVAQEKCCFADKIYMVMDLRSKYIRDTGKIHGSIDYIFKNQYGYDKMSETTIKKYVSYGEFLIKNNLMETAQKEKWVKERIESESKKYKMADNEYERISYRVNKKRGKIWKDKGFYKNEFMREILDSNLTPSDIMRLIKHDAQNK